MGSGLLNHLCVTVLPLPEVGWVGLGGRWPPRRHGDGEGCAVASGLLPPLGSQHGAQHGPKAVQVSAGTGKCCSAAPTVGIWHILPQAVAEVNSQKQLDVDMTGDATE